MEIRSFPADLYLFAGMEIDALHGRERYYQIVAIDHVEGMTYEVRYRRVLSMSGPRWTFGRDRSLRFTYDRAKGPFQGKFALI